MGVLDSIRIRHSGYSYRTSFVDFFERFVLMEPALLPAASAFVTTPSNVTRATATTTASSSGATATGATATGATATAATATDRATAHAVAVAGQRDVAQTLLRRLWAALPGSFRHDRQLSDVAQVGVGRVFLKKDMLEALEARRAAHVKRMDLAAQRIQANYRNHYHSAHFQAMRYGMLRVQALWRGYLPRLEYLTLRGAACRIQCCVRGWLQCTRYSRMRAGAALIAAAWRRFHFRASFRRLRDVVLMIHTLARSFILRRQLIRKQTLLVVLQRFIRGFLVRNRLYWAKVHGALLAQAAWRGYCVRRSHPDLVDYLAEFRRAAAKQRFFRLVFAAYKGRLVRERYLVMRGAAVFLQDWGRMVVLSRAFRRGFHAAGHLVHRRGGNGIAHQLRMGAARRDGGEVDDRAQLAVAVAVGLFDHPVRDDLAEPQRRHQVLPEQRLHRAVFEVERLGGHHLTGADGVAAGSWDHVSYRVAPGEHGYSVRAVGSATREGVTKTFDWAFESSTHYTACRSTANVPADGVGTVQLTIHADHFFYDSLVSEEPGVRFQALADADADGDGVITRAELEALAEVLRRHPQVLIATDDMYESILWAQEPFANIVMAAPDLYDRTMVLHGVSKAYSMTGWRIGYAAGPEVLIKAMAKVQSQSTSNPCSISQAAATEALNASQDCVVEMVSAFQDRHNKVVAGLNQLPGVDCIASDGTFYAFPSFQGALEQLGCANDVALGELLLEKAEVALVPGSAFGTPGHMRLSFATSQALLDEAIERLGRVLS